MPCSLPCIPHFWVTAVSACVHYQHQQGWLLSSTCWVVWQGCCLQLYPLHHHNNNIFEIFIYYVHKLKEWTFLMLSRHVAVSRICRCQPWQHWECGHVTRTFHQTGGPELKMNIIHWGHMYWYYIWFSLCLDTTSGSKLLESQLNSLLWTTLFTNPTAPVMDSWVRLLST